jgi:rhodanese-related sulfurtransferase
MDDISVEEFAQLIAHKKNLNLLDVRENLEYHTFNIGGLNIPLGKLAAVVEDEDLEFALEDTIIVICQRGLRSKTAKLILENAGYRKVRNLSGGLIKLQRIS